MTNGSPNTARSNLLVLAIWTTCIGYAIGVYALAGYGLKELLAP